MLASRATHVPVLLVIGPVGVGKTSVASELSELFHQAGIAHAFLDVDSLRRCYPRRAGDQFGVEFAMQNLAAIWPNFWAAGALQLVLADGIESRADLHRIETAVPGADICVVRLRAPLETLKLRVQQREPGFGRGRHLRRTADIAVPTDEYRAENILIETDGRTIPAIAHEIAKRCGWLSPVYG